MENQKFNPVVWFEIYVDDIERAANFYETVLNIHLNDMSDPTDEEIQMKGFPSADFNFGASGALVKMQGMDSRGSGTIVYFGSADCSIEESRVEAARGKIWKPKMSIGEYGFISILGDTEGNTFGVHSMK